MTRVPSSESGACFAGPHSPWSPPLAPSAPQPVAQRCSSTSQLLWQGLTSRVRSLPALAPHLPDTDAGGLPTKARRGISRFPRKERLHMPGSATTPDPLETCCDASNGFAFRLRNDVGVREIIFSRLDGWPAHSPTDASLRSSRATAHGSGPMRIATPSSYRIFTDCSLPVSRRTAKRTVRYRPSSSPSRKR